MPKRSYDTSGMQNYNPRRVKRPFVRRKRTYIPRNVVNSAAATGRIPASKTTMAMQKSTPFHGKKRVTFEYLNELTSSGLGANQGTLQVAFNDMYDFDKNGCFGNKQPLYYDTFMTSSGPYKTYKVISWETTYTIMNTSATTPITVWAIPPITATAEMDSLAEADNFPGVQSLYLTPLTGSKNVGTLTVKGHVKDCFASYEDEITLVGTWNASPTNPIYGGLVVHGSDNSTTPTVYVAIRHLAYTELTNVDALVS